MSVSSNDMGESPTPPTTKSTVVLLLGTIADTTWRMFLPTIGLTVTGLLLDKQFGTSPWLLVIGIIVGALGAAYLVRHQLKKVQQK